MVLGEEPDRTFRGRYRLLDLVGEGANARVYTADDTTLRRRVAVKILREELGQDDAFKQRFEQEMRAASALSLPRLLPVYDWGLEPVPHLVTEHVTGGSLADMLVAGHRLSLSQALALGLEVARALVNIHRAGRAYCGLSASSIMFDSQARVFVADLGVAASLGEAATVAPGSDGDQASKAADDVLAESSEADAGTAEDGAADSESSGADHDTAEPDPWDVGDDSWDTEVWDIETWGLDSDDGRSVTEQDGAGGADEGSIAGSRYTVADQQRDIGDLALILSEVVTGTRAVPVATDETSLARAVVLGPLQAVLARATTDDPADHLDAAGLVSELLRVASELHRPDPLPIVGVGATTVPGGDIGALAASPPPVTGTTHWVGPAAAIRSAIPLDDILRRRWPGLVLAVLLALGVVGAGAWAWAASRPDTEPMPDLAGQGRSAAASAIADSGWGVQEVLVREPGTVRGEVVRTEPAAGTSVGEGVTVEMFVSLGEPLVSLGEDLYGYTVLDATDLLEERGLAVAGQQAVNDEVVPPGLVVGLDIAEGVYELEVGSEVGLLVSDGPAARTVPELPADRSAIAAVEALFVARLDPREVTEFSADVPEGEVIGFRPASGSTVDADSVVDVRVSQGPRPIRSPDPTVAQEPGDTAEDSAG